MPSVFNDDEEVIEYKALGQAHEKKVVNLKEQVQLTLVPMSKVVNLPKGDSKKFPFMCKLMSQDTQQETEQSDRAPVDLICVIDRSGSMHGNNKWTSLVQTMNDLVGFL